MLMSTSRRLRYFAPLLLMLTAASDGTVGPRYTPEGGLVPPAEYREWVFLSSGLDMSYTENPAMQGHSMFDNVFVDPKSWADFKRSGRWPDKAIFAMESRGASSKGSINKKGHFQTDDLMAVEFHVRDETRFKGGWGFFVSNGTAPATLLPESAPCYACHQAHGAVDTTFTQFYPTAKAIAMKAGTFRAE
jgi:Cytochrome P460